MRQPLFWESSHALRVRRCCFLVDSFGKYVVSDMPLAAFVAGEVSRLTLLSDFELSHY